MKLVHDMAQNNNLPKDFDFLTKVLFHTLIASCGPIMVLG